MFVDFVGKPRGCKPWKRCGLDGSKGESGTGARMRRRWCGGGRKRDRRECRSGSGTVTRWDCAQFNAEFHSHRIPERQRTWHAGRVGRESASPVGYLCDRFTPNKKGSSSCSTGAPRAPPWVNTFRL